MREAHFKLVPTQLLLLCPMAPQGGAKGAELGTNLKGSQGSLLSLDYPSDNSACH